MVSQGTPEILGQMLVDMSVDGLTQRGKDPSADKITYAWHYSQATVTDQNSWQVAAEAIIKKDYPNWENVHPDNYYSNQDAEQAKTVGAAVLSAFPDIDLIICNDSTALPGQLAAAEDAGYDAQKITITALPPRSPSSPTARTAPSTTGASGTAPSREPWAATSLPIWPLATPSRLATPSPSRASVTSRSRPTTPSPRAPRPATRTTGVVLLPERLVFTKDNMNDYNF